MNDKKFLIELFGDMLGSVWSGAGKKCLSRKKLFFKIFKFPRLQRALFCPLLHGGSGGIDSCKRKECFFFKISLRPEQKNPHSLKKQKITFSIDDFTV